MHETHSDATSAEEPLWRVRSRLSAAEQAALADAYDVGEWTSWRRTPKGTANVTFFIETTTGRHVVRRSNPRKTVAGIRFEVRLLDYLRDRGYPAPHVIGTRDGEAFVSHNGDIYLMTALIPGGAYDPANPAHLREAGAAFARYHRLVEEFPGPYPVTPSPLEDLAGRGAEAFAAVLELAGALGVPALDQLRRDADWLLDELEQAGNELTDHYPPAGKLLIQASFGRSALIFEGEALTGVVDYDRVRHEALGMDLAYTIKAFSRILSPGTDDHRVAIDPVTARVFLDAYRTERAVPAEEVELLPLFFRAQRLVKVVGKCSNVLARHGVEAQAAKDVEKVALMARREVVRIGWLRSHAAALVDALGRPTTQA